MKNIRVEEDLSWNHFLLEKTLFKISAQNFVISLRDIIGLENFLLSFS